MLDGFGSILQHVKNDAVDLQRQLSSARKQLEEETLAKVDLENRVQSLKVIKCVAVSVHVPNKQSPIGLRSTLHQII